MKATVCINTIITAVLEPHPTSLPFAVGESSVFDHVVLFSGGHDELNFRLFVAYKM